MGFHYRVVGFHYRLILLKIWKVVFSQKFGIFFENFLRFFENFMCREQLYTVETSKFFGIFLSKLSIKKTVSFSQTCLIFQKWFPLQDNGFPLQGVSIHGKLVYKYSCWCKMQLIWPRVFKFSSYFCTTYGRWLMHLKFLRSSELSVRNWPIVANTCTFIRKSTIPVRLRVLSRLYDELEIWPLI
jgi:hypothetical protein